MELLVKICWGVAVLVHLPPSLSLFAPAMLQRLYGMELEGDVKLLMVHRGALFLAVLAAALYAMFSPEARKLASLVVGISLIAFLLLYARAGFPEGLKSIFIADAVALPFFLFAAWKAWAD